MNRRQFCRNLAVLGGVAQLQPFSLVNTSLVPNAFALESKNQHRQVRYVMGTYLDIQVHEKDKDLVNKFFKEAFLIADNLDRSLSLYKPNSEISRLNAGQKVELSKETIELVNLGKKYEELTSSRFNIAVGALSNLWNAANKNQNFPSDKELAQAKSLCTTKVVENNGSSYFLADTRASIETGGIGKGFALEKIKALLNKYSIKSALINFGFSTIYAHGRPLGQDYWKLALQFPGEKARGVLSLANQAASASSAYGDSFTLKGRKYGHIIDPVQAKPIDTKFLVATISESPLETEVISSEAVISRKISSSFKTAGAFIEDAKGAKLSTGFSLT